METLVTGEQSPSSLATVRLLLTTMGLIQLPGAGEKEHICRSRRATMLRDMEEIAEPHYEQRSGIPINDILPYRRKQ